MGFPIVVYSRHSFSFMWYAVMLVAFIRHGAVRSSQTDPELTSQGHRMSLDVGRWLKSKGYIPDICWSTKTRRTNQTAENIILGCESELTVKPIEMNEYDMNLDFLAKRIVQYPSAHVALFCCHQPLLEYLRQNFAPNSPPIRFASALIMRYSEGDWIFEDALPGRPNY